MNYYSLRFVIEHRACANNALIMRGLLKYPFEAFKMMFKLLWYRPHYIYASQRVLEIVIIETSLDPINWSNFHERTLSFSLSFSREENKSQLLKTHSWDLLKLPSWPLRQTFAPYIICRVSVTRRKSKISERSRLPLSEMMSERVFHDLYDRPRTSSFFHITFRKNDSTPKETRVLKIVENWRLWLVYIFSKIKLTKYFFRFTILSSKKLYIKK